MIEYNVEIKDRVLPNDHILQAHEIKDLLRKAIDERNKELDLVYASENINHALNMMLNRKLKGMFTNFNETPSVKIGNTDFDDMLSQFLEQDTNRDSLAKAIVNNIDKTDLPSGLETDPQNDRTAGEYIMSLIVDIATKKLIDAGYKVKRPRHSWRGNGGFENSLEVTLNDSDQETATKVKEKSQNN